MPPSRATLAALAVLLLAVTSRPAFAQTKPEPSANPGAPSAEDKAIATEKYNQGAALALKGRWQEAYPLLTEAWSHVKHWQIAASLGNIEVELGRYHAAEEHLSFAQGAADLPAQDR